MSGRLISFEGLDGVGKTTIVRALVKSLEDEGQKVTLVEEFLTEFLDGYLHGLLERDPYLRLAAEGQDTTLAQTLLLAAAHAFKYETIIKSAMTSGGLVLVDRFTDSLIAYQVPLLVESGLSKDAAIMWVDNCVSLLPQPSLTIYLIDDRARMRARRRARGDDADRESELFLSRVEQIYSYRLNSHRHRMVEYHLAGNLQEDITNLALMLRRDDFST